MIEYKSRKRKSILEKMATGSDLSTALVDSCEIAKQTGVRYSDVPLESLEKGKKKKVPRRILHFSDGTLEEYSTDEEDEVDSQPQPQVNTKELTWGPWFWYYTVFTAVKTLAAIDFCGEKLAWVLGITTPKYQSAINEYYRLKKEEEEEERQRLEGKKEEELQVVANELGMIDSDEAVKYVDVSTELEMKKSVPPGVSADSTGSW